MQGYSQYFSLNLMQPHSKRQQIKERYKSYISMQNPKQTTNNRDEQTLRKTLISSDQWLD